MGWSRRFRAPLLTLLMAFCVLAHAPAPQPRGTWTATAGSRTFRGSWGAEMSAHDFNSAQGYWTLDNDAGERIMQGTWSSQKAAARWHGNWAARTTQGRSFAGTWDAEMAGSQGRTFADMLTRTIEKEVAGTWQSGRYSGGWWLKGVELRSGSH